MGNLDDGSEIDGVETLSQGGTRVVGKVAGILDQPEMHDSMVVQERVWELEKIAKELNNISDLLLPLPGIKPEMLTSPVGQEYLASLAKKLGEVRAEFIKLSERSKLGPQLIMSIDDLLANIEKQDWESCKKAARSIFIYNEGFLGVLHFISDQDVTVVNVT